MRSTRERKEQKEGVEGRERRTIKGARKEISDRMAVYVRWGSAAEGESQWIMQLCGAAALLCGTPKVSDQKRR